MGIETGRNTQELTPEAKERVDALETDATQIKGELAEATSVEDLLKRLAGTPITAEYAAGGMDTKPVLSMNPDNAVGSKMIPWEQTMQGLKDVLELPDRFSPDDVTDVVPEYILDKVRELPLCDPEAVE